MHDFWKIVALGILAAQPWLAAAQQTEPVPVQLPARVDTVRQPVVSDAAANQAPRDVAAAKAAALAGQAQPMNALAGFGADYRIGPNDLLEIDVFGVADLKRTVRVNATGLVSLPLIGSIALSGLTAQQAEAAIAARYGEKYLQDPQISVFVKEFTSQRVTIEGAVARPGIYPLTGQITLLRAMALAGGRGDLANLENVMVYRTGSDGKLDSKTYDLDLVRSGEIPDPVVLPEDVIVVQRRPVRVLLRDSAVSDFINLLNPFNYMK
ncbi:MAG: polysaccharide export protein [Burkholderiaceae bacterium]|nr:polysaccharide export protein [Burkholderiaceae bacterium]